MLRQGKSLIEVRRVIDSKYQGVPTPTPYPKG
jgi:hypothetical protein